MNVSRASDALPSGSPWDEGGTPVRTRIFQQSVTMIARMETEGQDGFAAPTWAWSWPEAHRPLFIGLLVASCLLVVATIGIIVWRCCRLRGYHLKHAISLEGEFGAGPVVDNIPVHGIPVKRDTVVLLRCSTTFEECPITCRLLQCKGQFEEDLLAERDALLPQCGDGIDEVCSSKTGLHGCCHGTVDLRFHSLPDRGSSKPTWSSEDLQLLEGSPHRVLVLSKRLRNRMPMETAAMIARQRSSNEVNGEGAVPRDDKASLPDASSFANWPFAEVVYGVRSHV